MNVLYALIGVATDVLEMSVAQLTAKPKACEDIVQRVQAIGKAWDDHPDWHGRNWYVQVLLAIASLSRVVEWWQAEQSFWNFNQDGGEEDEPLQFVTKILDEDDASTTPPLPEVTPIAPEQAGDSRDSNALRLLSPEDESRLRLSRPPSSGKRSRDEKDVTQALQDKEQEISRMSKPVDTVESARVLATERLRLQAETAQNRNIVMELSLDGEHFIWVNYAWQYIVGSVWRCSGR
jgi:serine/threonine-protein kinase RIM15